MPYLKSDYMNFPSTLLCHYPLHSAYPFFLQAFELNTYRAALRISDGTGSTWGDK